jgi:hypothetical protein
MTGDTNTAEMNYMKEAAAHFEMAESIIVDSVVSACAKEGFPATDHHIGRALLDVYGHLSEVVAVRRDISLALACAVTAEAPGTTKEMVGTTACIVGPKHEILGAIVGLIIEVYTCDKEDPPKDIQEAVDYFVDEILTARQFTPVDNGSDQ